MSCINAIQIDQNHSGQNGRIFESVDELQLWVFRLLLAGGQSASPRGISTNEILSVSFELTNPRARITSLKNRRWSHALAVAELCWHLKGETKVDSLAHYAPRWKSFADDDGHIRGSCYGYRIFREPRDGKTQWAWVKELLVHDPDTRRAVLDIQGQSLLSNSQRSGDVSCATSMQFLIRDGKLHVVVSMRSNDAFWGLPYDVYLFSMLQEIMAYEIGIEVGTYFHHAASLHYYEKFRTRIEEIVDSASFEGTEMPRFESPEILSNLIDFERELRIGKKTSFTSSSPFWNLLADGLAKGQNSKIVPQQF